MTAARLPRATYRLQMGRELGFAAAAELVDYLDALGVDTVYLSPILAARSQSTSGYDVTDPRFLDPRLGTPQQWQRLADAARARDMGMLLDIVPNHMAASVENPWWRDVLTHGPDCEGAAIFDIDWARSPGPPGAAPRLILPVLGAPYDEVLARGELRIADGEGGLAVRYYEHFFPLAHGSCPPDHGDDAESVHRVLEAQHYRLAFWRPALQRINYRRFFDIADLVGVRVEDPQVFARTHEQILALVASGAVTGLRVDHIDGLREPTAYLERLVDAATRAGGRPPYLLVEKILSAEELLDPRWPVHGTTGYEYVRALVGVFVDPDGMRELEQGYERFLGFALPFDDRLYMQKKRVIAGLFTGEMRRHQAQLRELAGADRRGRDIADSDLDRALVEVAACFGVYRTYTTAAGLAPGDRPVIDAAIAAARERAPEVDEAAFGLVGRILRLDGLDAADEPLRRAWLDFVLGWQQLTGPVMAKGLEDTALYQDFRLLSLNSVGGEPDAGRELLSTDAFHAHNHLSAERWPATLNATSTHDSKRSEDVRARLHVLTDMPVAWVRALSRWAGQNSKHKPRVDGVPVPSRNVEVLIYQTMLGAWPLHEPEVPAFVERLQAYLIKAAREAKLETSWIDTNEPYEQALAAFVAAIVADDEFMADFSRLQRRIAFHGAINGLSQVLLKITSPGVPDFYQGTELWTFTLVDPDNRRPIDFEVRRAMLEEIRAVGGGRQLTAFCRTALRTWSDGRIKMLVTQRALQARRRHAAVFARGDYLPLVARGARSSAVCAFARRADGAQCLTVVPMRAGQLGAAGAWPVGRRCWKDDTLLELPDDAPMRWRNALTGEVAVASEGALRLADVLRTLPVALLEPL